jgi:hypothetical protein
MARFAFYQLHPTIKLPLQSQYTTFCSKVEFSYMPFVKGVVEIPFSIERH